MENILYANLSSEVLENLFEGAERDMLWSCQADPRFMYYAYAPNSVANDDNALHPVIVFIHGTGGAYPSVVRKSLEEFADENECYVMAPLFPGGLIDTSDFNNYKLISYHGIRYDLLLLAMLDELKLRFHSADVSKVIIFGHSGGGQYAHRFFYLHPERLKAVSISAPGRITFIDNSTEFFWGTKNWKEVFDKAIDLDALRRVPVQLMVGEQDKKFIGEASCGSTRIERIQALRDNFVQIGIPVELTIIPGIGHSDGNKERIDVFCNWAKQYIVN